MSVLRDLLYGIACALGLHHLARWRNRERLLVIAYHGLWSGPPPAGYPSWHLLDVRRLEEQLRYLRRHYDVLPLDEALRRLRGGSLRRPTACITFDDGLRSNHTLGLPVLRRLELPATVYLATGLIGTERRLWSVRVEAALRDARLAEVELPALGRGRVALDGAAQRVALAREVVGALKRCAPELRDAAIRQLEAQLPSPPPPDQGAYEMLDWDEVRTMERSGWVSFGAHTVNHEIVSRLDGPALAREIAGSVQAVAERVERPSRTFAYPNGRTDDFDARAATELAAAGCTAAVSTVEGLNSPETDPFALRRITVGREMGANEFRLLTSGLLRRRGRA